MQVVRPPPAPGSRSATAAARVQQPARRGGRARLRLGRGLRQVEADAVVEEQGAAVRRAAARAARRAGRGRPGRRAAVRGAGGRGAQPVPGGEGVLVRRRPHPARRVPVDGHLGPAVPGQLEGPLHGLARELAPPGEQIGLPYEGGGAVRVERVEGLGRGRGCGAGLRGRRERPVRAGGRARGPRSGAGAASGSCAAAGRMRGLTGRACRREPRAHGASCPRRPHAHEPHDHPAWCTASARAPPQHGATSGPSGRRGGDRLPLRPRLRIGRDELRVQRPACGRAGSCGRSPRSARSPVSRPRPRRPAPRVSDFASRSLRRSLGEEGSGGAAARRGAPGHGRPPAALHWVKKYINVY